jgi:hypothetical protein
MIGDKHTRAQGSGPRAQGVIDDDASLRLAPSCIGVLARCCRAE